MRNAKRSCSASAQSALLALLTVGSVMGCGAEDSSESDGGAGGASYTSSSDGLNAPVVGSGSGGSARAGDLDGIDPGDPSLPEEVELPPVFQPPVVTGKYLWSANPESGRVALIDAESLSVLVLTAGLSPEVVVAASSDPAKPSAFVLNTGSSDATFFEVQPSGVRSRRVVTHVGANRAVVSPTGRYAVAYSQEDPEALDPTQGLQEITIVDLFDEVLQGRRVTVGFRPTLVTFDDDESEVIVIADQGASLIDLSDDSESWVSLGSGDGRDVTVTADGQHALVRRTGSSQVDLVPLKGGETIEIDLPGVVTDLDLATSGRAVAVMRELSSAATFLVSEVLSDPRHFDVATLAPELVGSAELAADGSRAVLYTNAIDNPRVTILELSEGEDYLSHRSQGTEVPVATVSLSPGGLQAVTLGKGIEGSSSGSFSILSLGEARFPRIVGTSSPVTEVSLGDEVGVVLATEAGGAHEAHLIDLPALSVETINLASPPLSSGVVNAAKLGFAAQSHPAGRVTFFGFSRDDVATLTGFELSAEVVEE